MTTVTNVVLADEAEQQQNDDTASCPKCGSSDCEHFVESDAPADGVDMICRACGELFKA